MAHQSPSQPERCKMDGRILDGPGAGKGEVAVANFKTLGDVFDPKDNNFNIIRLFAALLVLVSHCYPLTGTAIEPIARYLGEYDTGGGWGVAIFFVISGFLVTRSVLERPAGVYLRSRALRIIPALVLVTLFQVLVIGPLFTNLSMSEFFAHSTTFAHLKNVSIFWLETSLPGVFAANPVQYQVNGSIWTLPIESGFYVMLPILAALSLLKPGRIVVLFSVIAVWLAYGVVQLGWQWDNQGAMLFAGGPAFTVVKEAVFFLSGSCLWVYRDRIPMNGGLAICCVLLLMIFAWRDDRFIAMAIALPYLVIYAALAIPFRFTWYEKIGDLSYGTYLFAFPIQQAVVAVYAGAIGPFKLALLSVPLTLGLAALSWYLVERPALAIRYGRGPQWGKPLGKSA